MSYFDISLDKDMDFLIRELGQDIKINNEPTRGLIQNIDNADYTNDDKELITRTEINRGNYIYYNKYWLVLSDINDKRYNIYNKGVIRDCNFDVKFIINNRLYLFPSIVAGDKFYIQESNIVDISADTITVTLPDTEITRQLKKEDAFIKWGQKWKVEGIDRTKDGLVILNCKVELTNNAIDDIENEIANRYKDSQDRLKGNTEPIYPFDDVEVPEPEIPEEPTEPEEPETPEDPDNPENPSQNITYSYTAIMESEDDPDDRLWFRDEATYIIHKFVDGEEIDAEFEFILEQEIDNLAQIESYTNNSATITTNFGRVGWIKLIAIDTETSEVAIEKLINVLN